MNNITPAPAGDQSQWLGVEAAFNDCTGVVAPLQVWRDEHAAAAASTSGLSFTQWMHEHYPELHPVTEIIAPLPAYPLDQPFRIHNGAICGASTEPITWPPVTLDMDRPDDPVEVYPMWLHDPTQPCFSPIDGLPTTDGLYIITAPRFMCANGDHDCFDEEHPTTGVLTVLRATD